MKEDKTTKEVMGEACLNLCMLFGSALIKGFVLMKLWQWIIVPIFLQPAISFVQAIALSIFSTVLMSVPKKEANVDTLERVKISIVVYLLILLMGWIVSKML